ncbi:class II fructose-bisphosphatase [Anaerococcus vaginalis]|uniref:class II fructose-bisphosphatase n=1 Tax=Anaerococcus vaginalis TaxID=33037 RepID=UPI002912DAD6|nr:class II fructose-bisphosphatase [Anaerococcus vaginalis]MDU5560285.1 class II fructose-bisphosphatase [Anaerococcus vaginalis]
MNRDLGINLCRVTEAAALASGKYLGKGKKNDSDNIAVDQMRAMFNYLGINGRVVIGEGEIDEAPMLYIGEEIGDMSQDDVVDIAVDPIDGTASLANGTSNSISVIAVAPQGCLLNAPDVYMNKIATGSKAKGVIDIKKSTKENIENVAKALNKKVSDITVSVLHRPRHEKLVEEIRESGARISMVEDGDVLTAIATELSDGKIDLIMGIGGAPEGVIAAAALKCLGGDFQGVFAPSDSKQVKRCLKMGVDFDKVYTIDDLVKGDDVLFAATGITDGTFLKGVSYTKNNMAKTQSLLLRLPSGTIRYIDSVHKLNQKLDQK